MGGTRECYDHDWVDLINGPLPDSPKIDRYCSTNKPKLNTPFHTTGNELMMNFKTDLSGTSTGFEMKWETEGSGCGNQLISDQIGQLTSTNYPNQYPPDQNCMWTIRTEPINSIKIVISDFHLEKDESSRWDYLGIGNTEDDVFGKYCGTEIPNEFFTDSNTA